MPFPNLDGREPVYTDEKAKDKLIEYYVNQVETADEMPTAAGLANYMGVSKKTVIRYSQEKTGYPQFSLSYEIMMDTQEKKLANGGLNNVYNANIVKLMLFNHGYTDKSQINQHIQAEVETKAEVNLTIDQRLEKAVQELKTLQNYD